MGKGGNWLLVVVWVSGTIFGLILGLVVPKLRSSSASLVVCVTGGGGGGNGAASANSIVSDTIVVSVFCFFCGGLDVSVVVSGSDADAALVVRGC